MQQIFIAGRLGQDAKLASPNGKDVCNFSVAVDQGYGQNKTTNWWRCALWGRRAVKLAEYLTKGTSVAVSGQFSLGEYDGKPQLNIDVAEIDLMGGGERKQNNTGDYQSDQSRGYDDPTRS